MLFLWTVKFSLEAVLQTNGAIETDVKEVIKKQLGNTPKRKDDEKQKWRKVEFKWEKVTILRLLLTPLAWRVVLVCPHFISVSVIINYTNMAATSHVKLAFLKSIFAEFGHCHEEKISAVPES